MDALKISVVVACVLSLVGCGKSAPSCDDSSVKDLVMKINAQKFDDTSTGVEDIRVTDKNDKTGSNTCEAKVKFKDPKSGPYPMVRDVKYTTELTTDGKIYVQAEFSSARAE